MYSYDDTSSRTWNLLFAYGGKLRASFSYVVIKLYAMLAIASFLATTPWIRLIRWQFSLRTLLIATTLVAVVLGLAVWASR